MSITIRREGFPMYSIFFTDPPEPPREKPSLTPVLLSATIFPGIGQFQQKRTVAGMVYLGTSGIAFIIATVMIAKHLPVVFHILWETADPTSAMEELKPILRGLGFFFALYLANVYDTWYAWFRLNRAWKRGQQNGNSSGTPPPPALTTHP
ncbi:MAG: hypothetical protein H3C50_04575 [Kiritimatiellae bacterium]|nr:hypothetical protein [Kiritimatiellia bacterium]